jgi:diguanylate cyclase (GGDEF)-like protein
MSIEIPIVTSAKRWWHQPDSFHWISHYLRARGMMTVTRALIALVTLSLAVIGTVVMLSPVSVQGTWSRALVWIAIAGALGCSALWVIRWPTKRQSLAFILVINLCIAVVCHMQSDPLVGLIGCVALAVTGSYIACFHSAGYLIYNYAVAIYLSGLQASRYGFGDDTALVLAALMLVLLVNLGAPFGVQAVVHVLGIDLMQARHDPLTGLLNRRAFFDRVDDLLHTCRTSPCYLAVIMVDLDRFKALNDSHGHTVGDQALVAVGRVLTEISPGGIITGRVGGEEFLLADLVPNADPPGLAQQVCDAVATLPFPITASVGTVVRRVDHLVSDERKELVRRLHTLADAAMYEAKRAGGNQVSHACAAQ